MDPNNETPNQPQAPAPAPTEPVGVHTPPPEAEPSQEAPVAPETPATKEEEKQGKSNTKPSQPSPFDPPKENSVMPAIIGAIVFVLILVGLVLFAFLKSKQ